MFDQIHMSIINIVHCRYNACYTAPCQNRATCANISSHNGADSYRCDCQVFKQYDEYIL